MGWEFRALQKQLFEVQQGKSVNRLNEANVIELVTKLIDCELVELIISGHGYITPQVPQSRMIRSARKCSTSCIESEAQRGTCPGHRSWEGRRRPRRAPSTRSAGPSPSGGTPGWSRRRPRSGFWRKSTKESATRARSKVHGIISHRCRRIGRC